MVPALSCISLSDLAARGEVSPRSAILKQVSNMAITGNGSLATFLFLFLVPAALHKGRIKTLWCFVGMYVFSVELHWIKAK